MDDLVSSLSKLYIDSPDFATLFSTLPPDIQGNILSDLPFIDVMNLCSTIQVLNLNTPCFTESYFRQRLLNRGVPINKYQDLSKVVHPQDAYIQTLVHENAINQDPTIVVYLMGPDILFPGLEYVIGLAKMGLRAISHDDREYLLYVLHKYPSNEELKQIIGTLFGRYMIYPDSLLTSDLHRIFEVMADRDGLSKLGHAYYPSNERTFRIYQSGLTGTRVSSGYWIIEYFYGLIDGRQDDLFVELVNNFPSYLPFGTNRYVAWRGTVMMAEAIISKYDGKDFQRGTISRTMFEAAVEADNLAVVDLLLSRNRDVIPSNGMFTPVSEQMVDLLKSHNMDVTPDRILLGALRLGNYDLLLKTFGQNWLDTIPEVTLENTEYLSSPDRELSKAMTFAPVYLMTSYLRKFRWETDAMVGFINEFLLPERDFYRIEALLGLGFQPSSWMKAEIINSIKKSELVPIIGLDLTGYPNLSRIYQMSVS